MVTIPLIGGEVETLDLSYGTAMTQNYRRKRVDFGDGYSQRARDGLNVAPQQWQLSWLRISDADTETLRVFFEAQAGVGIIDWAPYNQNQALPLKWTATGWSARPAGYKIQDCGITLTQEFDL